MCELFWENQDFPQQLLAKWLDGEIKEAVRYAVEEDGSLWLSWHNGMRTVSFFSMLMAESDFEYDEKGDCVKSNYRAPPVSLIELYKQVVRDGSTDKEDMAIVAEECATELEEMAAEIRAMASE